MQYYYKIMTALLILVYTLHYNYNVNIYSKRVRESCACVLELLLIVHNYITYINQIILC